MNYNILYNPFTKIAGFSAMLIGVSGIAVTSYLAYLTGTHYNGFSHIDFASDSEFWVYLLENCSHALFLSTFLYLYTLLFTNTKVRIVDIIGTILVSRIPLIITPIIRTIPFFKSFVINSLTMYSLLAIYLISITWTIILLYNAYKVACNLKENKLIFSLLLTMAMAEISTKIILILIV